MHRDHDIFVQAIKEKRKIWLTFFNKADGDTQVRLSIPMDYEPHGIEEETSRYYLWDTDKSINGSFIILFPNNIVSMKLDKGTFDPAAFITWDLEELPWFLKRNWGQFS